MTTIINEQRDRAYENASPEQKELYESPESGKKLQQIAEAHSLTKPETYRDFAITVGDVILGLRSQTELPEALASTLNLSTTNAVKVTGDIIDFLGGERSSDLTSDIAEAEAALEAIPKVRTMADDVSKAQSNEPTHTSTQEALLREASKPIPPPQ